MSGRRAVVTRVSFKVLSQALRLPEGMSVVALRRADDAWSEGEVLLRIAGEALPETEEGRCIPEGVFVYERQRSNGDCHLLRIDRIKRAPSSVGTFDGILWQREETECEEEIVTLKEEGSP